MPSLSDETNGALAALEPGMTIGIVGGGQLGRMMALSAKYMGFRVGVLDPTDDCPTAQVADFQIVADYDDTAAIRALADHSDVLTYEFENVDADALDAVRDRVAIPQGTDLLRVTQNRIAEKTFKGLFGRETIKKWLKAFFKRFFSQQFKRSCVPDGVKVGSVSLSPRGDWRMPSDAVAKLWLDNID